MKPYEYYYLAKRNLLSDTKNRQRIQGNLQKNSRIHVSAACGKAMASVTCMLADLGYSVTASDESFHPPMSDVLQARHITCSKPDSKNIENIDLIVVGNMLPSSAVEVVAARHAHIPMMSGSEVLREILAREKRSLVVAGTHGKTTTSSLLTHVFLKSGKNPAYMIGGSFQNTGESYSIGIKKSSHVIFEGDEYDCAFFDKAPKFLRYNASSAIITSIEYDHVDLYPTFEDYTQAFQFLVDDVSNDGFLVLHDSVLQHIDISNCTAKIVIYGKNIFKDVSYEISSVSSSGTSFSIVFRGQKYSDIFIPLFGEYNIANATSVFILAFLEGVKVSDIISTFSTYPGVHERQEIIGEKNGVIVVRDFAHHPTAVRVTLEGIRSHYPGRRIVCVFEPRSVTSRRKAFETEYPKALEDADISIVVSPPFKYNDDKNDFMDVSVVQNILELSGKLSHVARDADDALKILSQHVIKNDIVVFMSNGDFNSIPKKFLESYFF